MLRSRVDMMYARGDSISTTSSSLARAALDSLVESGVTFSLLHRAADLISGEVPSDVDMAVGEPPRALLRRSLTRLHQAGLHPVVVWEYDVGGTATVFLSDRDGSNGVQLDLLYDPDGLGTYGVRTQDVIASAEGDRWPAVRPLSELAYLIRKRQVKGDQRRLEELLAEARKLPTDELTQAVRHALAWPAAEDVLAMVERRSPSDRRLSRAYWMLEARRLTRQSA